MSNSFIFNLSDNRKMVNYVNVMEIINFIRNIVRYYKAFCTDITILQKQTVTVVFVKDESQKILLPPFNL